MLFRSQATLAASFGADRIELYTESYAKAYDTLQQNTVLERYRATAAAAQSVGLGVNAGHDLSLRNLRTFLGINGILEVSIGHALIIECIEQGMDTVIPHYLRICGGH